MPPLVIRRALYGVELRLAINQAKHADFAFVRKIDTYAATAYQ
jgi:hypothetical protein